METIERSPIVVPVIPDLDDELQAARSDLLAKAAQQFGYQGTLNPCSHKHAVLEYVKVIKRVKDAFAAVGINPHNAREVASYRERKQKSVERLYRLQNWVCEGNGSGEILMCIAAVVGMVATVVGTTLATSDNFQLVNWLSIYIGSGVGIPCLLTWWTLAFLRHHYDHTVVRVQWTSVPAHYTGVHIPDFALAHAVALHDQLASLSPTFYVEYLNIGKERSDPDPFLRMDVANASMLMSGTSRITRMACLRPIRGNHNDT